MNNNLDGVWVDIKIIRIKELKPLERFLFAVIYELSKKRVCNASNEYLSNATGISVRAIKDIINRLEKKEFIERDTIGRSRKIFLRAENVLKYNLECKNCNFGDNVGVLNTEIVSLGTNSAQYNIDNKDNTNKKGPTSIKEVLKNNGYFN